MLNEACGVPLPVPERSDLATKPEPHAGENVARSYTPTEKAKITAGAVTALVVVAWLVVVAFALLAAG